MRWHRCKHCNGETWLPNEAAGTDWNCVHCGKTQAGGLVGGPIASKPEPEREWKDWPKAERADTDPAPESTIEDRAIPASGPLVDAQPIRKSRRVP